MSYNIEEYHPTEEITGIVSGDIMKDKHPVGEFTTVAEWNMKEKKFKGAQLLEDYVIREWRTLPPNSPVYPKPKSNK